MNMNSPSLSKKKYSLGCAVIAIVIKRTRQRPLFFLRTRLWSFFFFENLNTSLSPRNQNLEDLIQVLRDGLLECGAVRLEEKVLIDVEAGEADAHELEEVRDEGETVEQGRLSLIRSFALFQLQAQLRYDHKYTGGLYCGGMNS